MSAAGANAKETEFKFRLESAREFAALCVALHGRARPSIEQVNHFFDTSTRALSDANYTLRLRSECGSKYLLTAKGPERRPIGDSMSERAESECVISDVTAGVIMRSEKSPLSVLEETLGAEEQLVRELQGLVGYRPLLLVGTFTNTRTPIEVQWELGGARHALVFEMDRTVFPSGRVDFEVEVEVDGTREVIQHCDREIRSLFIRAGIHPRPSSSKAARLFAILSDGA